MQAEVKGGGVSSLGFVSREKEKVLTFTSLALCVVGPLTLSVFVVISSLSGSCALRRALMDGAGLVMAQRRMTVFQELTLLYCAD